MMLLALAAAVAVFIYLVSCMSSTDRANDEVVLSTLRLDDSTEVDRVRGLYLDMVKRALRNVFYSSKCESLREVDGQSPVDPATGSLLPKLRWPFCAHSMSGIELQDSAQRLAINVIKEGIPGDFVETGIWRGGFPILFRAVLQAYGEHSRVVFACDSFEGLPPPDPSVPQDAADKLYLYTDNAVSMSEVRQNIDAYGLLDEQVRFVKGYFKDTMPQLANDINTIALLRLDGDMYQSTMDVLSNLYPKVPVGGYVIIDDYQLHACREAVTDFRARYGISDPIHQVHFPDAPSLKWGSYWRVSKSWKDIKHRYV